MSDTKSDTEKAIEEAFREGWDMGVWAEGDPVDWKGSNAYRALHPLPPVVDDSELMPAAMPPAFLVDFACEGRDGCPCDLCTVGVES